MSEEQGVLKPHEIQIGRHYWFVLNYDGIEVNCVIKVLELSGEIIEGRILDTDALSFFSSRFADDETSGISEEYLCPEIRAEHILREVNRSELKFLLECIEESTQDFFSMLPSKQKGWMSGAPHRTLH